MKTQIVSTAILSFITLILSAQIIHVPGDQPTIQDGINAANNGDIVLVDTGIYYENIDFLGKAITVASNYLNQKDSIFIYNTIIDGSQSIGSVVSLVMGEDTSSCIYGFTIKGGSGSNVAWTWPVKSGGGINMYNSTCKIECNIIKENEVIQVNTDGWAMGGGICSGPPDSEKFVVIRNNQIHNNLAWAQGTANAWNLAWGHGGGIVIGNSGIIEGNIISENICKSDYGFTVGGGLRMQGDNILVKVLNNKIIDNKSIAVTSNAFGGGISCSGANTIVERNNIRDNITNGVASRGSGIYFDLVDSYYADVINNLFVGNTCITNSSYCYGGAIGMTRSYDLTISNNLFTGNSARHGGVISIADSYPVLMNNTFTENIAEESGGGIYIDDAASGANVINTILWNDSANGQLNEIYTPNVDMLKIVYSDVQDGWDGEGNINEDPLFTDDSCHLYNCFSPCINAGIDSIEINGTWYYCPLNDIDNQPRPYENTLPDIGADETPCLQTNIIENKKISESDYDLQVYPNPVKTYVTISFLNYENGFVLISVYDIAGKYIQTILSQKLDKGNRTLNWNAESLNKGIYFIRLETKDQTITEKVIVLR